jgi:peptidoglycan/LPS O-acetylase OafA/YrhL
MGPTARTLIPSITSPFVTSELVSLSHPARRPVPARRGTLAERFDPRDNSIAFLRLMLALSVVLVHALALGWQEFALLGGTFVGDLAVDGFFVVSGFLVTRSALGLPTLRRFAWHRFLRIMPGFWASLVLTAVVAAPLVAWLQGLPATRAFTGPDPAHHFVLRNASLFIQQWGVGGLRGGPTGQEEAMNGALWTLFYEAVCYGIVAVLVAVGIVRGRRGSHGPQLTHALPLAMTGAVWLLYAAHSAGLLPVGPEYLGRFVLLFLLGALGHLFADRIRFTALYLLPAAAVALGSMFAFGDYRPTGALAFAYLLLWATVALPVRWTSAADISYGLYVYHWPIQLVLLSAGAMHLGRLGFTVLSLLVVGAFAIASWHFLEAPALRCKNARWINGLGRRASTPGPVEQRQPAMIGS